MIEVEKVVWLNRAILVMKHDRSKLQRAVMRFLIGLRVH